ncbi:MAG TPA: BamA/TamA family outer membrane protein, partial [Candidatus Goldiibacteriota bacterium]|nr:BamA/TamA family outer membrane protein [Candidatus Goldiibacteriota bacterium]
QFGNQKKSWQLSYKDLWLFDMPVSFGLDLWNVYKNQAYNNQGYDLDTYGFNISFGRRFGIDHKAFLTYRYQQDNYTNIRPDLAAAGVQAGESQISSITPMYVYDTRDDIFDANRGAYASASLQFGGGWLGGDYNYIKATADMRYFIPSFWKFVLALHLKTGYALSYDYGNGRDSVPVSERFYCGGTDTVRGYEERSLGPLAGGNFLIVTNIEYKLKVVERVLTAALFYDSGNCWTDITEVDWTNPYLFGSIGAGVRLTIPGTVMVLRLDWGYALDNSLPGGKIHFNIGNIF